MNRKNDPTTAPLEPLDQQVLIHRSSPPEKGTIYEFPEDAKARRKRLPRRLVLLYVTVDGHLDLTETDGPPWPDADTRLTVEYWNAAIAPLVMAVYAPGTAPAIPEPPLRVPVGETRPGEEQQPAALRPGLTVRMVPIAEIDDSANLRMAGEDGNLPGLTGSILDLGMLQPVILRRVGDRLRLVAGHRRLVAARTAGQENIEAKVYESADDRWEAAARLAENVQRKDLNHVELSRVFVAAVAAGMTVAQVAEQGHLSDDMVRRHLAIARLCEPVQRLVASGRLPIHQAELIAHVGDPAGQIDLARSTVRLGWDAKTAQWKEWERFDQGKFATDYVMPMGHLREEVARKLRGLAAVGWPMDENYAGKPACIGCPDNTATYADQPTLFAGIRPRGSAKRGHCTNAACYEAKSKAWEKVKTHRRRQRDKDLKAAVAKAKRAGLEVCEECATLAEEGQKFKPVAAADGKKLCPGCTAQAVKRPRSGDSYDARQREIAALRKKFPWTPEQRYAVALYDYAGTLTEAVGSAIISGFRRQQAAELLLALELRPINHAWLDRGEEKRLPMPAEIARGGHFGAGALSKLWMKRGSLPENARPEVKQYRGGIENVPLGKDALAAIGLLEAVAKAWKVQMPARPIQSDFPADPASPGAAGGTPAEKKLLTTIATGNKEAALKALAACTDIETLGTLPDLKGDWRRAAVSKRMDELSEKKGTRE